MAEDLFKNVISHAKEYGFIFQSSEIYDGLSAVYDYGQNGALLKNNIKATLPVDIPSQSLCQEDW